jgi:branched-chain amino acid aminotransferase
MFLGSLRRSLVSRQALGSRLALGRCFSSGVPDINYSGMQVTASQVQKPRVANHELKFGHTTTDHMLQVDWTEEGGWRDPQIGPYGTLNLDPACSVFHYALECFEGMKAYIGADGEMRMFRPDMNMKRMNQSMDRLQLPTFDGVEMTKCIARLLQQDQDWCPTERGYSLYIRPTGISTEAFIGVAAPKKAKLFVILSPVGPYYPTGFAPVKLLADPGLVRAWPGGTGAIKCGGNYAMGMQAQKEAASRGYQQILWLYGEDCQVTEVGTMNQFFFWVNQQGERELITAPLDGTILPGVTRDSVLTLARNGEFGDFKVTERHYTIHEVIDAIKEGRMIESFGSGTAAIVSPVNLVHFQGVDYEVPLVKEDPSASIGKLAEGIITRLMNIQYGDDAHEWSVRVKDLV